MCNITYHLLSPILGNLPPRVSTIHEIYVDHPKGWIADPSYSLIRHWKHGFGHGFLQHFSLNYQIYRQPPRRCATAPLLFCSPSLSGRKRMEPWVKVIRTWPGWRLGLFVSWVKPQSYQTILYTQNMPEISILKRIFIGCNYTSSKPWFFSVFM